MSSKDISTHATYGKEVDIRKYPKIPGGWRRYEYVDSITQTLLALFEELLWRRDFEAASEVLTVLMTQTKAIPDVIFKAGVTIIEFVPELNDRAITFFRKLISLLKKDKALPMVLEFVILYLKRGQYEDAKLLIESYWSVEPFNKNHHFVGYHGIACIALWQREEKRTLHDFLMAPAKVSLRSLRDSLYVEAKSSLERAIAMKPDCTYYFYYYIQLLIAGHDKDLVKRSLSAYCEENPNDPVSWALYGDYLIKNYPKKNNKIVRCILNALQQDPLNDDCFVHLLDQYAEDHVRHGEILPIIIQRIIYCPNDTNYWKLFAHSLSRLRKENQDDPTWIMTNEPWFLAVHPLSSRYWNPSLLSRHKKCVSTSTLLYRCICSVLIFGVNDYCEKFIKLHSKDLEEIKYFYVKYEVDSIISNLIEKYS